MERYKQGSAHWVFQGIEGGGGDFERFIHLWIVSLYDHYYLLFLIFLKKNILRGHGSPNLKKYMFRQEKRTQQGSSQSQKHPSVWEEF